MVGGRAAWAAWGSLAGVTGEPAGRGPRGAVRRRSAPRPDEPAGSAASAGTTAGDDLVRALYEEHGTALLGFVLRLVGGDRQRAEDVVQETLLRAWRHPEALESEHGSVRPWLFTVARNLVIDGARARRARPPEAPDSALAGIAVDDGLDRTLTAWAVADAVAGLSPAHRDVLVETYFRDRSVAEAAAALGVPEGTVKSRTFYALRALRLALEERGVLP